MAEPQQSRLHRSIHMQNHHAARQLYLLYHELHTDTRAYAYGMDTSRFAEHLALIAAMRNASSEPVQAQITFDDGHRSNHDYALPLLREHNLQAWFFLTAGWIEQRADYLDWRQAAALHAAGHGIGAHGWSHALLTHCNAAGLQKELRDTRALLEDRLGTTITALSFPGGRYNARVLDACAEAGYTRLFTSRPQTSVPGQDGLIGRLNIRRDATAEWLRGLLAEDGTVLRGLERQDQVKTALKRLLGDRAYASLWRVVNRAEADA